MGASKMPSPPPSPYKGTREADVAALSGMRGMQNAPNYAMQAYQQYSPGFAGAMSPSGYDPAATVGAGNFMTGQGMGMYGLGNQLYNLGMDPQNALYNKLFQQQQEQTRAGEAARGIATSPVGAAMEQQGNRDFNIAWQNNLLQRALQGAAGAQGMYGAGAQNILGGQGMAASVPGMQAGLLNALQGAGTQAYALPQQNIQNWLGYLGGGAAAQNQAYQQQLQAYQAKMQQQQGLFGALGQAGGAAASMYMMSDRRTKRDITHIGILPDETPVYTFRYKDAPEIYIGVMAQDILTTHPKAVRDIGGILHVNYATLMEEVSWV